MRMAVRAQQGTRMYGCETRETIFGRILALETLSLYGTYTLQATQNTTHTCNVRVQGLGKEQVCECGTMRDANDR